jgi:hypothetical protein
MKGRLLGCSRSRVILLGVRASFPITQTVGCTRGDRDIEMQQMDEKILRSS